MLRVALLLLIMQSSPAPAVQGVGASQDYQIGPDDILKVTVYGHEDLTQTIVVQADGTFNFPLIGRVAAADKTPKALQGQIAAALANGFVRDPQVSVVVQEYRSKVVFVVGEIVRPGTYPLSGSRTLVEILSRAGPMSAAAGSEIIVVRPRTATAGPLLPPALVGGRGVEAVAEVIRIDLRDLQAGHLDKNIQLQPNDTVFVPEAAKVFVSGEVRNPGAYPFTPGTTVRQAISLAGGFSDRASTGRVRVIRDVAGKPKEIRVSLDDAVEPGDTIIVKEKLF